MLTTTMIIIISYIAVLLSVLSAELSCSIDSETDCSEYNSMCPNESDRSRDASVVTHKR